MRENSYFDSSEIMNARARSERLIRSPPLKMALYSCFTSLKSGSMRFLIALRPAAVNCSFGPAQKRRESRRVRSSYILQKMR